MKNQIRILKNFSIRCPKTGRHYTFVKDTIAKGKQIQFATTARIEGGQFRVESVKPTEASIYRRRDGRRAWHKAMGTNSEMDMEMALLDALCLRFTEEQLRDKTSGQNTMFSHCADAYIAAFPDELTLERVDGSDDAHAKRNCVAWRGIVWANTPDTALRCKAFILDYVLNRY